MDSTERIVQRAKQKDIEKYTDEETLIIDEPDDV
jgi:hypothetical protein